MRIIPYVVQLRRPSLWKSGYVARVCALLVLLCASVVTAQAQGGGMTPPGMAPGAPAGSYSLSGFENVNLFNGNLNFNLPLLKVGGRGRVGSSINLALDSRKWEIVAVGMTDPNAGLPSVLPYFNVDDMPSYEYSVRRYCTSVSVDGEPPTGSCLIDIEDVVIFPGLEFIKPAPGTRGYAFFPMARPYVGAEEIKPGYGPGVLRGSFAKAREEWRTPEETTGPPPNPETLHFAQMLYRLTFVEPDGTEHELVDTKTDGEPKLHSFAQDIDRGRVYVSIDGSGITFVSDYQMGDFEIIPGGLLFFPDGTRAHVNGELIDWVQDADGNRTTYIYGTNPDDRRTYRRVIEITDTLGRKVAISYADFNSVMYDELKFNGVGGTLDRSIKVWYSKLEGALAEEQTLKTVGELFPITTRVTVDQPHDPVKFNPIVPSAVELPDGRKYELSYNSFAELAHVDLPTGAAIKYEYPGIQEAPALMGLLPDRRVRERYASSNGVNWESKQVFEPSSTTGAADDVSGWDTAISVKSYDLKDGQEQLASKQVHYFHGHPGFAIRPELFYSAGSDGREYKVEDYDTEGAANTVLRTEERTWKERYQPVWWTGFTTSRLLRTAANAPTRDPRVSEVKVTLENGLTSRKVFKYSDELTELNPTPDSYNNLTDTYEYDFAAAGTTAPLLRHTHTDYVRTQNVGGTIYDYACSPLSGGPCAPNAVAAGVIHIRKLPASTEVRDGAGNLVARSEFTYDEPSYMVDGYGALPTGFPGYAVPATPARGHLTTTRAWLDTLGTHTNPQAYLETHTQYDRFGNALKVWDARGKTSEVKFAAQYKYAFPTEIVSADPDGAGPLAALITSTAYDFATGVTTDSFDVNNQQTHLEYESTVGTLGRLKKVTPPAGASQTEYDYVDAAGNLQFKVKKQVSENVWDEVVTYFDNLGRATKTKAHDALGDVYKETLYDGVGRIRQTYNPYRVGETKHWVETSYDGLGRVKEVVSPKIADEPTPAKLKSEYSTATTGAQIGLVQVGVNQAGKRARSIMNALGQLVRVDEPNEAGDIGPIDNPTRPTFYTYNTLGNLIRVKQGEQSRLFLYDSLGRLIRVRQPEQEVNPDLTLSDPLTGNAQWTAGLTYDENGNVRTATDARGVTITYEYDSLGRLIRRSYAVPQTSDPKKVTLSTSEVTYKYDGLLSPAPGNPTPTPVPFAVGKLTEISNGASTTQYTEFDNLGRVKSSQQIVDGQVYPFGYKYNLSGEVYEETYPSGRVVTNAFDNLGDLSSVSSHAANEASKVYVSDFKYTADGAVERLKLGNQKWETYKYNARQQVTQIGLGNSATDTSLWKVDYEYGRLNQNGTVDVTKNDGNLIRQTITVPGAQPYVQTYAYDPLNRLTEAVETVNGQQTWKQTFGYDRYGNRTDFSQIVGQTTLALNNINHPEADLLTNRFKTGQGYEYDLNGNIIRDAEGRRFAFDGDNRQGVVKDDSSNVVATYDYDGSGKRVKKTVIATGEVTVFVYDAIGKLAAEYSNILPTAGTRYVTADIVETPRVITDKDGGVISRNDYMPFGEELTAGRSGDQKYGYASGVRQGFTGYEKDEETRLSFAEARYYNSQHGRFTAVDPLLASGRSSNPQSYNRYAYAGNNPTLRTDPDGEDWFESTRDILVGYTRRTEISYQWKRGSTQVRSHIVFTTDGPTRGLVVLDKWENRFKEVASIKEGQAQFEVYRKQAALNYLAGVAEALSLTVELSGAFDGLGVERNSEQYLFGKNEGTMLSTASAVLGGGGAVNFLAKHLGPRAARYVGRGLKVLNKMCFVAGTPVHTDRGLKAIEEIKVGDKVLSWDEMGKRFEYKTVALTFVRRAERLVKVYVAGEAAPIIGTPEHPFYVRVHRARDGLGTEIDDGEIDGEWVYAEQLEVGNELLRSDGTWASVSGVEADARTEAVYNFKVEGNHNYFVGELGILVHNNDCLPIVKKAVNSEIVHASERAVERGFLGDVKQAAEALRDLSKQITQSGLPVGTVLDPDHADRVLVPFQEGLYAVYQVGANGTAKLKTVLIAR